MRRDELRELHFITPIDNVVSILSLGILSHRLAQRIQHLSVAMDEIQERRRRVVVPGGRPLHEYANLYINARNPMMFKRKDAHTQLCVLRVSSSVLDLPGVIITDMNAAKSPRRFRPAAIELDFIDREMIFANDWRHPGDPLAFDRHRGIMCAEVLVPDKVEATFIIGVYVSCSESDSIIRTVCADLGVEINNYLFFR